MINSSNTPQFSPQVFIQTTVLNFSISQESIREQLMHTLVLIVDSESESKKQLQVQRNRENRIMKEKKENEILDTIKKLGPKLLDDEALVISLTDYRIMSDRTENEIKDSKVQFAILLLHKFTLIISNKIIGT